MILRLPSPQAQHQLIKIIARTNSGNLNVVCYKMPNPAYAGSRAKHMATWREISSDPWVM